ncbi:hypothetical protein AMECASPLE_019353 [Ameca splendens]|uniref:Uncharacterized protein n=1 Tax=Ameca splendens TaxID=208324 RepID=A0ABV0ZCQ2_9TELE
MRHQADLHVCCFGKSSTTDPQEQFGSSLRENAVSAGEPATVKVTSTPRLERNNRLHSSSFASKTEPAQMQPWLLSTHLRSTHSGILGTQVIASCKHQEHPEGLRNETTKC